MAKDRNSFAKRQREVEKKRKADEKRERRFRKKQRAEESSESDAPEDSEPTQELG